MDYDCVEIERRLAIGFNDYLSLAQRDRFVRMGKTLGEIAKEDPRFRLYTRETRDVIHWLSRSRENHVLWHGDPGFPAFSPVRRHLPYMLFCQGEVPTDKMCMGAVGTRHATYSGLQQAFRFGLEAARNSVSVASGFAEGIDQSVMNGCLAGGGPCIGVLACGHDVEYPNMTQHMRSLIIDSGGCVLSRFAPSEIAYKSNFLSRNIIIAAYGDFVVAVQAPGRSGTLNTCDYATQMGKDLFVGSEGIGDRFVQVGTTALFQDGAKIITSLSDIPFMKLRFSVVECDDRMSGNELGSGDLRRFGDRMYMVREMIS